jgi:2-keto-4-pentenoate hydratase/2-oxohepta-3-ene-1,7-dioic acid hydratase in catechol pathway
VRIFRYATSGGGVQPRLAVAVAGRDPVDLIEAWPQSPRESPFLYSTRALIEAGPSVWAAVVDAAGNAPDELRVGDHLSGYSLLCPFDEIASLRDFLAFEDHVKRGAERRGTDVPDYWYSAPVYYKSNHRSLVGPDEACSWPPYTNRLDFELELAMIIGVRGRDVAPERAEEHVFGFTVFNDFSARDIQSQEMSAWLGPAKGKDFANSFGPCIVTADEVGAEPDLEMVCRVNGEEWGRARSSDAKWRWADMIAHVSASEDVYPGDVYGSGTPGGCCGIDLGRELRPGDVVELEIESIGVLRNTIGSRA